MLPKKVKVVEVGPRDGLQNEEAFIASEIKVELINRLYHAGIINIEAGSFVSEKAIPQLSDTALVLSKVNRNPNINYSVLVPNNHGMEKAVAAHMGSISIFTTVSEKFCQENINCTIAQSLKRFEEVIAIANERDITVRGYISCVMGCPYQGRIDAHYVAKLAEDLIDMGCAEISLGDTIGVGTINQVNQLIDLVAEKVALDKVAVHFHDSYGQALANVYAALLKGISIVDSSVAGLGGCPYAKGSSGNLATEDLIYMLNGLAIDSGINLEKLITVGHYICKQLDILPRSRVSLANMSHQTKD